MPYLISIKFAIVVVVVKIKLSGIKVNIVILKHTNTINFLKNNGIDCPNSLIATQEVGYQRISLANDAQRERLTLDLNVNFANTLEQSKPENNYTLSNFFIAELKQEKLDRQSPFYRLMRKMSIRSKGFSKYCMGHALTNNKPIKSNRFKANVIKLNNGANQ